MWLSSDKAQEVSEKLGLKIEVKVNQPDLFVESVLDKFIEAIERIEKLESICLELTNVAVLDSPKEQG